MAALGPVAEKRFLIFGERIVADGRFAVQTKGVDIAANEVAPAGTAESPVEFALARSREVTSSVTDATITFTPPG